MSNNQFSRKRRPARYVGQADDEKQTGRRLARGLPPLVLVPDKDWVCTTCGGPCSESEYRNNQCRCVKCWLKS
ncbi:MAG: hypothetical protein ACRYFV_13745 [Janthinobacterium lividum]